MFFCKVSIQIEKCCRICSSPEKSSNIFNYISGMIMIYFSPLRCFSRSAQKASTTSTNANRNIIAEPATFVSSAVFTPSVFCEPDVFPAAFVPLEFVPSEFWFFKNRFPGDILSIIMDCSHIHSRTMAFQIFPHSTIRLLDHPQHHFRIILHPASSLGFLSQFTLTPSSYFFFSSKRKSH